MRVLYSLLFVKGFFTDVKVSLSAAKTSTLNLIRSIALAERRLLMRSWESLNSAFPQLKVIQAQSSINEGIGIVIEIIFLAVGLYVAAFILPGALTAIATTALTSVNPGVMTLFQVLVPLIAVVVLLLLLIAVIRKAMA